MTVDFQSTIPNPPTCNRWSFSYETVRDWEARFAPLLADQVRRRRQGRVGRCWYVDETYLKVSGRWCYLYRAIDKQGQLVDSMLSPKRDRAAAQRFFRSAQTVAGRRPEQVTTDGHGSDPRAMAEVLGKRVKHRCRVAVRILVKLSHSC